MMVVMQLIVFEVIMSGSIAFLGYTAIYLEMQLIAWPSIASCVIMAIE